MPRGPRGEKRPGGVIGAAIKVAKIALPSCSPGSSLSYRGAI